MPIPSFPKLVIVVVFLGILIVAGIGHVGLVRWLDKTSVGTNGGVVAEENVRGEIESPTEINLEEIIDSLYRCDWLTNSVTSINIDTDEAKETLALCGFAPAIAGSMYIFDDRESDYEILYSGSTDPGASLRTVSLPELVDIDEDGIHEIYWTGSNYGGTCTCSVNYMFLYSYKQQQAFSREDLSCFDAECIDLVDSPSQFSPNLEIEQFKDFKEYLEAL